MTTFTASEVVAKLRERFASGNDVPVPDVRLTRAEFDVVADRLEADEKVQAVGFLSAGALAALVDCRHDEYNGNVDIWMRPNESVKAVIPLYTHPDPADAERLAEALRAKIRRLRNMPNGEFQLAASIFADDLERILGAHSAQAQPPAASVPDAMQELADKYHELLWAVARKFPGETRHETALRYIREAECQEAALAAQENPNG